METADQPISLKSACCMDKAIFHLSISAFRTNEFSISLGCLLLHTLCQSMNSQAPEHHVVIVPWTEELVSGAREDDTRGGCAWDTLSRPSSKRVDLLTFIAKDKVKKKGIRSHRPQQKQKMRRKENRLSKSSKPLNLAKHHDKQEPDEGFESSMRRGCKGANYAINWCKTAQKQSHCLYY